MKKTDANSRLVATIRRVFAIERAERSAGRPGTAMATNPTLARISRELVALAAAQPGDLELSACAVQLSALLQRRQGAETEVTVTDTATTSAPTAANTAGPQTVTAHVLGAARTTCRGTGPIVVCDSVSHIANAGQIVRLCCNGKEPERP